MKFLIMYNIIKELRKYPKTSSAILLLFYLNEEGSWWKRITQKLCRELLNGSPTQALKILQQANVLDLKEWRLNKEPSYDNLLIEDEYPPFSHKYWPKFFQAYKSFWKYLVKIANDKRYSEEEYFTRLFVEVKKDKFWSWVITQEMLLRKIILLNDKFGWLIPKNVVSWWLWEITHIF